MQSAEFLALRAPDGRYSPDMKKLLVFLALAGAGLVPVARKRPMRWPPKRARITAERAAGGGRFHRAGKGLLRQVRRQRLHRRGHAPSGAKRLADLRRQEIALERRRAQAQGRRARSANSRSATRPKRSASRPSSGPRRLAEQQEREAARAPTKAAERARRREGRPERGRSAEQKQGQARRRAANSRTAEAGAQSQAAGAAAGGSGGAQGQAAQKRLAERNKPRRPAAARAA